jgi:hypothetical protein
VCPVQQYVDAREPAKCLGHVVESGAPARLQGYCNGVVGLLRVEHSIENQPHIPSTELVKLAARALGLCERRRIWTRHQDEGCLFLIAQCRL